MRDSQNYTKNIYKGGGKFVSKYFECIPGVPKCFKTLKILFLINKEELTSIYLLGNIGK
jgi:hypothetical protein